MKTIFTFVIVLLPILSIYISPIRNIDLGTFCLLLLSPFVFAGFLKRNRIKAPYFMCMLILYTCMGTLFSFAVNVPPDLKISLLRMGKFVVVLSIVFVVGNMFFNYTLAKKILKVVTTVAVLYIIVQTVVFYFTGRLLPSVPFNLVQNEAYGNIDYVSAAARFYRPTSFFLEPAHFSQYVLLYLAYSLFGDYEENRSNLKMAIFITIGLFASTSGQGILLGLLIWGLWWFDEIKKANIKNMVYLIILAAVISVIILPLVFQTRTVNTAMNRLVTGSGSLGDAVTGRLFTYNYYSELPVLQKIIGMGYGNVPKGVYFNSIAYTLYCSGIIGLILIVLIFLDAFIYTRNFQRYFCIIYALLILGSASFTATSIAYYFMFIYSGYKKVYVS